MDDAHSLKLELRIAPRWPAVEPVREAVGLCVGVVCAKAHLRDAVAMAAAELMENAIKYGGGEGDVVTLLLLDRRDEVVVQVTNRLPRGQGAEGLAARLAWIAAFPSADEAYAAALREVAAREPGARTASGLGLVRIVFEGGCRLSLETSGDLVTMRASRTS